MDETEDLSGARLLIQLVFCLLTVKTQHSVLFVYLKIKKSNFYLNIIKQWNRAFHEDHADPPFCRN